MDTTSIVRLCLPDGTEQAVLRVDAESVADALIVARPEAWRDAVYIQDDTGAWLGVLNAQGIGWVVSCLGKADTVEQFMVDPRALDRSPRIVRTIAGEQAYPAHLFVPRDAARAAIVSFIARLERDKDYTWTRVDEAGFKL